MKPLLYLQLQDGRIYWKTSFENQVYELMIPRKIFQNGHILDYHHFFYLIKKLKKQAGVEEKISVVLLLHSDEIIHINYKIPKVDPTDLDSFLQLELEDFFGYTTEDYDLSYWYQLEGENIKLSIDLIPKSLTGDLYTVLEKTGCEVVKIFPTTILYEKYEKILSLDLHGIGLYEYDSLGLTHKKIVINQELLKLFDEENLESDTIYHLATGGYDSRHGNQKEDFLENYNNLLYIHWDEILKFIAGDSYIVTGMLKENILGKTVLKENPMGKYIEEKDFLSQFHYQLPTSHKNIRTKLALGLLLFLLIGGNLGYNKYLNQELLQLNEQRIPETEIVVEDNSKIHQEKNKEFLELIFHLQEKENERIMFTDYIYDAGQIQVKGLLLEEKDLKILEELPILHQRIYQEDGLHKFEIILESY